MAIYKGKSGSVKLSTNTVANVEEYTLEVKADVEEVQEFGDSWKERAPLLADWSARVRGKFNYADTNGQKAIVDELLGASPDGAIADLRLYIDGTHYFSGAAVLTGWTIVANVAKHITVDFSFEGNGALTYT